MKKLFTFFTAILFAVILFAQAPQIMSYQAVVRDASNKLVVNHQVGMQISIVQSSEDGKVVYTEMQTPTTNANGLVSIKIGDGAGFPTIDWTKGPYFIKTKTDPAGGTSYTITGVSQLLSVPYALYAEKSGSPGPQGDKGDKGDKGDPGQMGIQGVTGATGLTTSVNGVTQIGGAITLTKSNIGLGNVDNTSDDDKPVSSDTQDALDLKVDKVSGKGLSSEDYSTAEKAKLTGIAVGAEVNVNADWNAVSGDAQILNKPTLFTNSNETDPVYAASEAASITNAGSGTVISTAERTKLSNIAENANVGVVPNLDITGATKTKIKYDKKGLVIEGTDATTADIAASSDKNYVTDAQKTVIGNTSGTNTGDNAVNSNYSGLVSNVNHSGDAEGATSLTVKAINGVELISLTTGILKNTGSNGKPSIAVAGDFPTLNQNTTGTAANVTGTVAITNGGTGATTATNAINALLPAQTGNSGKYLTTNGSATSWAVAADGSETKINAGTSVTVTGAGTALSPYVVNATGATNGTAPGQMQYWDGAAWVLIAPGLNKQVLKYINGVPTWSDGNINDLSIGDSYQGGIIAYFLVAGDPGFDASIRHGLIAAPSDQSTYTKWGCAGTSIATGTALGTGNANTNAIESGCPTAGTAADICANLSLGGYTDWYLPSRDELNKLYINRAAIGGFTNFYYWSSSNLDGSSAWLHLFYDNIQSGIFKDQNNHVRAIRSF